MKATLSHIQINVSDFDTSVKFYKEFLGYLDYEVTMEDEEVVGFDDGQCSIFLIKTPDKYKSNKFHRKNPGLNHLCFKVGSKENVDRFTNEFLNARNIKTLYDTPKLFAEYTDKYYAVFFEDPDRIKLEVAYY